MHDPSPPAIAGARVDPDDLLFLRALAHRYPGEDVVLAEIAALSAELTLPKGVVHVVSDVHGEYKKLRHIINNASGHLRPLVETLFAGQLDDTARRDLLNLLYYPSETWTLLEPTFPGRAARSAFVRSAVDSAAQLLRALAPRRSWRDVVSIFPDTHRHLLIELIAAPAFGRSADYVSALVEPYIVEGRELELLRVLARAVRNLSVAELIVAGDLGDRGPRIDRVIQLLMQQPQVSIVWGNHDALWMAACLGHELAIATVLRLSLRYHRISQLEEGYGVPLAPLEKLTREAYADDPAERFAVGDDGVRDPVQLARMQKAIAIIQFKLEARLARRRPELQLEDRALLRRVDLARGVVVLAGKEYPLLDTHLPTFDPVEPDALTPAEQACIARLRVSFLRSPVLWEHMQFVLRRGSMVEVRDRHLIFHACVPIDAAGEFLTLQVDAEPLSGRRLFTALERVIARAFRERRPEDLDLMWYLWGGERSPLFGKDKMATFEGYFIADPQAHVETKNPYFGALNDPAFCRRILTEFDVPAEGGLIVNGHLPVRVERGERPLKKGGLAIVIDGAFSEGYGDRGYTLVLEPERTTLAQHHHFESATDAITSGADIVPDVTEIRGYSPPRRVADTEQGEALRREIAVLGRLLAAFRSNLIPG